MLNERMLGYAQELIADGFKVYVHPDARTWFYYSIEVEGRECFGYVQQGQFATLGMGFEHAMPIRPSVKTGSSLVVLTTASPSSTRIAREVAAPSNRGRWVDGIHANHRPSLMDRCYLLNN